MNQLHKDGEQRFIDMAARLASEFAGRAAHYDEEESFPHENYALLRESGYTILGIPEELGGLGATMLQRIKAQETLAQGCGATALAINMHFNSVGLLVDFWRRFKNPQVEDKLLQIAKGRLICGGSASEPDNAVPVMRPRTTAQRVNGGPDRKRPQDLRHAEYRTGSVFQRSNLGKWSERANDYHFCYSAT